MCSTSKSLRVNLKRSSMGSRNHVAVVELSSDEEEIDTRVDMDYFNWLNDVMEAVDEKSDSTDVVEVLSEVKGGVDSHYRKSNSSNQSLDDDDDDDCVILDGDPDKTTKTAAFDDSDKLAKIDDNDDDEVFVVGQKGEIACRDFPHPRHSCAKYSFNSTSHDKYCDMCHCYVCDIRAPCPYWCMGVSGVDHCHANDKEKIWKNQREYFRTGIMPTEPSSKPTQNIIRVSQNTLPRNQLGIRPCSSSTGVANPSNSRARYRTRQSTPHNQGLQSQLVQSLNSVRNSGIQKVRSPFMLKSPRSRVASSAATGNNIGIGLYNSAQVSQSTHHSPVIMASTVNSELYTEQRNYQLNVTDHCSAVPGSQNNVYNRYSDQAVSGSGNWQFQTNVDLFAPSETLLTAAVSQAETVQQQPGTNENVLEAKLSELENWLIDNSNQPGPVSPFPEPVSEDYAATLTFDFETFLNN